MATYWFTNVSLLKVSSPVSCLVLFGHVPLINNPLGDVQFLSSGKMKTNEFPLEKGVCVCVRERIPKKTVKVNEFIRDDES